MCRAARSSADYALVVPRIRDQAVPLRRWDWSETSQAALLFSREHGLVRGLAKGAKRERGAFSGGIEPLTLGEFGAIIKPSTELATLTDWDLREVFRGPRASSRGFLLGHYAADLVRACVRDADPHAALWDALLRLLRALDEPAGRDAALARFQWSILTETGYAPELPATLTHQPGADGDATWAYDPAGGVFVPASAPRPDVWRIRDESLRAIADLAAPSSTTPAPAPGETIGRVNRFLAACIARTLDEPPPTMRRLFDEPKR